MSATDQLRHDTGDGRQVAVDGDLTTGQDSIWVTDEVVRVAWLAIAVVTFIASMALIYQPSLATTTDALSTVLPWPMFAATLFVFVRAFSEGDSPVHRMLGPARLVAVGTWSALVLIEDDWSIYSLALFSVCFSATIRLGMVLAAVATAAWAASYLLQGVTPWVIVLPLGVFALSSLLTGALHSSIELNDRQAELIRELTETRMELATVERSRGMLEERARFAAEIHDTLAQGFTSIVLLSRAGQRGGDGEAKLAAIESTALENLDAARRLIDAVEPAELDSGSLPDALSRQVDQTVPTDMAAEFRVVGHPRQLTGAVEVTLLRAAQEALLNVRTHSRADRVDVTLSYLDGVVALDVRDDGVGFETGTVSDRGELTGGQGLQMLSRRAEALAGELTIEANEGGGSVVSVLLPVGA